MSFSNAIQGFVSNSYAFAWCRDVYPYDCSAGVHVAVEEYFRVRKDEIEKLAEYLDQEWQGHRIYTFYQLEAHFGSRGPNSVWPREKLINAMR